MSPRKIHAPLVGCPTDVELHIGGYPSAFSVRLIDGDLVWRESGQDPIEARIVPTAADWAAFGAELDRIGVWQWKRRYEAGPGVMDGTSWEFTIVWRERVLRSSGSNAYPGSTKDCEPSAAFVAFTAAVSRLVGGRAFW